MKKELMILVGAAAMAGCGFDKHMSFGISSGIQGSGVAKTESRTVGDFKGLDVAGSMDVKWTAGSAVKVTVKCDDNLLKHLKTEVKDGSLKIYFDTNVSTKTDSIVEITSPNISAASVTGSGDLIATGIKTTAFTASVTGSGNVTLNGSGRDATYSVTGSGDLDGSKFAVDSATVSITGSGNVDVNSKNDLTASIMGSGDIAYSGDPKVTKSISGSGEVHKK